VLTPTVPRKTVLLRFTFVHDDTAPGQVVPVAAVETRLEDQAEDFRVSAGL
jgi:hypothetical protein